MQGLVPALGQLLCRTGHGLCAGGLPLYVDATGLHLQTLQNQPCRPCLLQQTAVQPMPGLLLRLQHAELVQLLPQNLVLRGLLLTPCGLALALTQASLQVRERALQRFGLQ